MVDLLNIIIHLRGMIDNFDNFESVSLIRFPPKIANQINEQMKKEEYSLKKKEGIILKEESIESRLTIKWNQDKRHCTTTWKGDNDKTTLLKGRLCDLPTIIETYKTTDKKTFYKSGTCSQMIILAENEGNINIRNKKYNGTKDSRRFQLLGGIAPPLKNVKKRRFRKIIRKRHCEAPEVEKELKKLLRDDQGALSVEFELVPDPEWEKKKSKGNNNSIIPDMTSSESDNTDDEEKPDFEQHLSWIIPEEDNRSRRLQEQASKFCHDINKLRERTSNRQREHDASSGESS
jgi:hypothetical protein